MPKTFKNLYPQIYDFDNLYLAWKRAGHVNFWSNSLNVRFQSPSRGRRLADTPGFEVEAAPETGAPGKRYNTLLDLISDWHVDFRGNHQRIMDRRQEER